MGTDIYKPNIRRRFTALLQNATKSTIDYFYAKLFQVFKNKEVILMFMGFILRKEKTENKKSYKEKFKDFIKIKLNFNNPLIEHFNVKSIFNSTRVKRLLPIDKNEDKKLIIYKCDQPIRNAVCNYSKVLNKISEQDIIHLLNSTCDCSTSRFLYAKSGHVITGDLSIIVYTKG